MTWLGLIYIAIGFVLVAMVVWLGRALDEIRRYRSDWQALADTQRKHEVDIRYLRELVNPMARTGKAPLPKHLRQEN